MRLLFLIISENATSAYQVEYYRIAPSLRLQWSWSNFLLRSDCSRRECLCASGTRIARCSSRELPANWDVHCWRRSYGTCRTSRYTSFSDPEMVSARRIDWRRYSRRLGTNTSSSYFSSRPPRACKSRRSLDIAFVSVKLWPRFRSGACAEFISENVEPKRFSFSLSLPVVVLHGNSENVVHLTSRIDCGIKFSLGECLPIATGRIWHIYFENVFLKKKKVVNPFHINK